MRNENIFLFENTYPKLLLPNRVILYHNVHNGSTKFLYRSEIDNISPIIHIAKVSPLR